MPSPRSGRARRELPTAPDRGSGSEHFAPPPPVTPRIVGGDPAPVGRYPYLASLSLLDHPTSTSSAPEHKCTGSLIAPDIVLTGAHCLRHFDVIEIGRYDISDLTISPLNGDFERFWAEERVPHPRYVDLDDEFAYDVAVVKLYGVSDAATVELNRDPDVPSDADADPSPSVHAMGWGVLAHDSDVTSDVPLDVELSYVPNDVCAAAEGELENGQFLSFEDFVVPSMMCTRDVGEGACQGDSGGPLVIASEELRGQYPEEFDGTVVVELEPVTGWMVGADSVAFQGACGLFLFEATLEDGSRGIACDITEQVWTDPVLQLTVQLSGTFDPPPAEGGHSWVGYNLAARAAEAFGNAPDEFLFDYLMFWDPNVTFFDDVERVAASVPPPSDRLRQRRRRGRRAQEESNTTAGDADDVPRDLQVGVVAFGYECGHEDFPGIYTRVSSVMDFIEETVCELSGYVPDDFDCSQYGGPTKVPSPTTGNETVTLSVELEMGWYPPFAGFLVDGADDGKVHAYYQPGSFADVVSGNALAYVQVPRDGRYRFVHLSTRPRLTDGLVFRVNLTSDDGGDDQVLLEGVTIEDAFDAQVYFEVGSPPAKEPTVPSPTAAPTSSNDLGPFVTLVLSFDGFPEDTGWAVRLKRLGQEDEGGELTWTAVSKADTSDVIDYRRVGHYEDVDPVSAPTLTERIYLPPPPDGVDDVEYELKVYDAGKDGMCCDAGEGFYRLYFGPAPFEEGGEKGRLLLEGGDFESSDAQTFLASDANMPTESPTAAPTGESSSAPTTTAAPTEATLAATSTPTISSSQAPTTDALASSPPTVSAGPTAFPTFGTGSPVTGVDTRSGAFATKGSWNVAASVAAAAAAAALLC